MWDLGASTRGVCGGERRRGGCGAEDEGAASPPLCASDVLGCRTSSIEAAVIGVCVWKVCVWFEGVGREKSQQTKFSGKEATKT